MFELTGALSHVLPIMVSVMTAKWVGEAFGKEGIYPQWIALRNYPWMPQQEYRDKDERLTTESVMCPVSQLVVIEGIRTTLGQSRLVKLTVVCCVVSEPFTQDQLVQKYDFNGFPVVQEEMFLGFVGREKLRLALGSPYLILASPVMLTVPVEQLLSDRSPTELAQECTFSRTYAASEPDFIDLSSLMEVSVLELRTEVPLELVVNMIHNMVRVFFFSVVFRPLSEAYNFL
jgi:chloride channel 3/4/5